MWAAYLSLALVVVASMIVAGSEAALSSQPAQSDAPAFESADYRIKDGTGPCVDGGVAYLFAGDDPWGPPLVNSKIVALDAGSGAFLWQKDLEWAGGMGSKARPLIDGNRLYIGCGESVYCLDITNNGNILWKEKITPDPPDDTLGPSTIISDPVMYTDAGSNKVVVVGDFTYGAYVGVDVITRNKWHYVLDDNSSASGAPGVDDSGNRLYLPQSAAYGYPANGKVHCINVATVSVAKKWEYSTAYDVAGLVSFDQGYLYFSDFAYGGPISNFYCLEDKGNQAGLEWSQPVWGSSGTPLVDTNSNTVYVCGNDYSVGENHFYAFDMDSGDLVWDNPNWGAFNGNCALSPTTGYLYAGSFDAAMWAHNKGMGAMDPGTGSELWYVQQKAGGDPVVTGGLVYSTADGRLYAYEEFMPSTYDWFFAEGYTGSGFEEWLCLANPGGAGDDASVSVTYLFNGEREPLTVTYPVPAGTRSTIDVKGAVGPETEVSIKVVSDKPIVAERPIYFEYQGLGANGWSGGHCVVGTDEPLGTWYFAEGYTGSGFEEWLCLANFSDQMAVVDVTYLYPDGAPLEKQYGVPGNRRVTLSVNREAGPGREVSLVVDSNRPIVAERPIYFAYGGMGSHGWSGGHCVMGSGQPSERWYFAEGYTGSGFEEWLCLANPNGDDADVTVTYMYQGEQSYVETYAVPANSRRTLSVNLEAGSDKELGMMINSSLPILAERPMYFSYGGARDGGHCVAGVVLPGNYWCLAEGYTGPDFDQYICISNPGKEKAEVSVKALFGGGGAEADVYEVEAGQRFTISLKSAGPVERAYAISSDRGVVVERVMYFDYMGLGGHGWNGGHCTQGATLKDIY